MNAWALIIMAAAVGIAVCGVLARLRINHLARQRRQIEVFYEAAHRLAGDDRTPDRVLQALAAMSRGISSKILLWFVFWHAITGRMQKDIERQSEDAIDFAKALDATPSDRVPDFLRAMHAFTLALTLNNVVLGTLMRRLMLAGVRDVAEPFTPGRVEPIVGDVVRLAA
jgi:hypothetical protein